MFPSLNRAFIQASLPGQLPSYKRVMERMLQKMWKFAEEI